MDLREFYQEVILDHNKSPRNRGHLEAPDSTADGYNPLCGDKVHVEIRTSDGKLEDVAFDGEGCAISLASASLMTEAVKGLSIEEAERLFTEVQAVLTGKSDAELDGELQALAGVKALPVRIKCAVLPWHALHSALTDRIQVKTE